LKFPASLPNWIYHKIERCPRFKDMQCNLILERLQGHYELQFVHDGDVFMRLYLSRELVRNVPFRYVVKFIEDNFKNDCNSLLTKPIIHEYWAKQMFDDFATTNPHNGKDYITPDFNLEQVISACLIHVDKLPMHENNKLPLRQAVVKLYNDYK
jgi:hypothetical protein